MNSLTIRLSVMMLFQYAIWGAWAPTLNVYLDKLQFTGTQAGMIFGCLWLACIVAPLIGGQIVDRFMPTQYFLAIAHLAGGAVMYAASLQTDFSSMWKWMMLYSLLYAPTLALTNSLAFHHLKGTEGHFGRIRLWGTLGWILAGWALSVMRNQWNTAGWEGQCDLLFLAAVLSVVMGIFCFFLPHTPPKRQGSNPLAFLEALSLLKDRNFLVFILCSFVVTTELQFFYIPTPSFLKFWGLSDAQVPTAMTLAQIAEILVLLFLLHVSLKKFGVRKTMMIGILAWPVRYLLFTVPWFPVILASLTLHGFGYAFFFVASQIYVNQKAKDDMRASAQALLAFFTLGLGSYVGTLITGWCMDYFKGPDGVMAWTPFFLVPAGITIAAAVAFMVFFKDDVEASEEQIKGV